MKPTTAPAKSLADIPSVEAASAPSNVVEIASAQSTPLHLRALEAWRDLHKEYSEIMAHVKSHPATKSETKELLSTTRLREVTITDRDLAVVYPDKSVRKVKAAVIARHDAITKAEKAMHALLPHVNTFRLNDLAVSGYDAGRADGLAEQGEDEQDEAAQG